MAAILLMDHDHFSNLSLPCPKEAPHEIWATLQYQCGSCISVLTLLNSKDCFKKQVQIIQKYLL